MASFYTGISGILDYSRFSCETGIRTGWAFLYSSYIAFFSPSFADALVGRGLQGMFIRFESSVILRDKNKREFFTSGPVQDWLLLGSFSGFDESGGGFFVSSRRA